MKKLNIDKIKNHVKDFNLKQLLEYFYIKFDKKVVIASSMGLEDQIILNEAMKIDKNYNIFTIDTGRIPQETYDLIQETNEFYNIKIKIYFPDFKNVEKMINDYGPNLFYESIEKRKLCCYIRKVEPLKRALKCYKVWISGLRREQSVTRFNINKIEWDDTYNLIKLNPLVDWTLGEVWEYIKREKVPYNKLHNLNYASIGCAPCTRAIKDGEDIRAGRWWWETPEHKECGIHIKNGKIIRTKRSKENE